MTQLNLLNTQVDYEGIRSQLQANLATKNSWAGLLTTQTGQTIIDWIATVGALGQGKALRYAQDAYSETAISDRAQYAIADMQGLRLTRKGSAQITVQATYIQPVGGPSSVTIPAFTQYQGAGTYWYTNQAWVLPNAVSQTLNLYQGYIVDQTIAGLGTDYQLFVSVEDGFSVSNDDVFVFVNDSAMNKGTSGLWLYPSSGLNGFTFLDQTTPDGRLRVLFGNAAYGYSPKNTDSVRIVYAVTSGLDGNSIAVANSALQQTNNLVTGVSYIITSTQPTGGGNQPAAGTYKYISSTNFGSFGSAVTKSQYLTTALQYPGIVDVKTFAQRELDITNYSFMNTVKVVPLTTSSWTSGEKTDFLNYLMDSTMYSTVCYWADPTAVSCSVTATIYCYNWATLSVCQTSASTAVSNLFALEAGILSYDIMLSDVYDAILQSNTGIAYVDIAAPTQDMVVSGYPMQAPSVVGSSTGGTLAAGTYSYSVYATDVHGSTTPASFASVITSGTTSSVTLMWTPYPNATSYTVVGRVGGSYGIIATVSSTTFSYIDNGTIPPTGSLPTPASYPVLYNTLTSLTINTAYAVNR